MADTKISGLTAITGADTAADDDFVVVDTSAAQTKRITRDELKAAVLNTGPLTIGGATIFSGAVSFNAIAETKSVTAVDVFVYDTSKDSDGGAWRNRTQATSWYNETLNTAARGSRKDFPAVAVIVAEAAKVTIYDGDDPDLPMWRVEDYTGLTLTSINAINGSMAVAASTGLILSSYVGDDIGSTTLDYTTATTPAIVNNAVNDVAMTVLPDAPIDPATGIQVPTIAVATNGGVSVIRDDGTVVDITNSSTNDYSYSVSFGANNFLNLQQGGAGPGAGWLYVFDEIPAADTIITNNTKTGSTASPIAYYAKSGLGHDLYLLGDPDHGREGDYIGTDAAIVALAENPDAPTNGMVAYVTSDYNTGWMNGDIKGAFLSDTDDTDVTGGTEPDRSVNANTLTVNGTITKTAVATGAELVAYSGFSASNYLEQPYNSDLDFGTGDFCVMGWFNTTNTGNIALLSRADASLTAAQFRAYLTAGQIATTCGSTSVILTDGKAYNTGTWRFLTVARRSGVEYVYIDGVEIINRARAGTVTNVDATLRLGLLQNDTFAFVGSLALWRISATAPTAEQIAKIYNDEKFLFQDNAQAKLYGASNTVTALAHDDTTGLLHVGTSAGRSVFQGLRRVSNTTTAVGTAISASNSLVVEE
jgi:hypothetical protein